MLLTFQALLECLPAVGTPVFFVAVLAALVDLAALVVNEHLVAESAAVSLSVVAFLVYGQMTGSVKHPAAVFARQSHGTSAFLYVFGPSKVIVLLAHTTFYALLKPLPLPFSCR